MSEEKTSTIISPSQPSEMKDLGNNIKAATPDDNNKPEELKGTENVLTPPTSSPSQIRQGLGNVCAMQVPASPPQMQQYPIYGNFFPASSRPQPAIRPSFAGGYPPNGFPNSRRNSWLGSNQARRSSFAPQFAPQAQRDMYNGTSIPSPNVAFSAMYPFQPMGMSPGQFNAQPVFHAPVDPNAQYPNLAQVLREVPAPVPTLYGGPGGYNSLEAALYNPTQTTNVYVRGLAPDMTDEALLWMAQRFGSIKSSKAIIDQQTGSCKGFGFAMFENEAEACACIIGLSQCGYQCSFAKESFSTRLRNLQDNASTNLYISNLPLDTHERDLEELFQPYQVVSNRILRDATNNMSRGVGFARMMDREAADAIIEKFNGKLIPGCTQPLQVRYADSPQQKRLKGSTARRRFMRAREYNVLTGRASMDDPLYAEMAANFGSPRDTEASNEQPWSPMSLPNIPMYMQSPGMVPFQTGYGSPMPMPYNGPMSPQFPRAMSNFDGEYNNQVTSEQGTIKAEIPSTDAVATLSELVGDGLRIEK